LDYYNECNFIVVSGVFCYRNSWCDRNSLFSTTDKFSAAVNLSLTSDQNYSIQFNSI